MMKDRWKRVAKETTKAIRRSAKEKREEMKGELARLDRIALMSAPIGLKLEERLEIIKRFDEWPRLVLALYDAELVVAQKQKDHGKASDVAYEKTAKIIRKAQGKGRFNAERVHALCNKARRQIKAGEPRLSVDEFEKYLQRDIPGSGTTHFISLSEFTDD